MRPCGLKTDLFLVDFSLRVFEDPGAEKQFRQERAVLYRQERWQVICLIGCSVNPWQ